MSRVHCEGWWEQPGFGRQPMEQLQLSFNAGEVTGAGIDVVGAFRIAGRLEGATSRSSSNIWASIASTM